MKTLTKKQARKMWLQAQRLDGQSPFGRGSEAVVSAVEHLGYVQIDTINVIERCHHHILFTRIPSYKLDDLNRAQARDKSVFEYWTHALSYVPTRDFRYFMNDMDRRKRSPGAYLGRVEKTEMSKVLRRLRDNGTLSIRDIQDDVLVDKDHEWDSRKPSKRALQLGFYTGKLAISERVGMLKKYDLMERHFHWSERPKPARDGEVTEYLLNRALRAQAIVSLDSICHLDAKRKPLVAKLIAQKVRLKELEPVAIEGLLGVDFWMQRGTGVAMPSARNEPIHILSPFDPLVIQRKRLKMFFEYEHRFEAYLPAEKRIFGYFGLPVLIGDRIVAILDLKTDRQKSELLIRKWTWLDGHKSAENKQRIEAELGRFERFQLSGCQSHRK